MILNDEWIEKFGREGGILPFDSALVNPASYDVRLSNHWIVPQGAKYNVQTGQYDPSLDIELIQDKFIMAPGSVVLACTSEYISLPRNVCADLKLKSTIGRNYITHMLSGWIDCSFKGQITLELHNTGPNPFKLHAFMPIAQLVFMEMKSAPQVAYGEGGRGRYQGQKGTTRARSEKN